MVSGVAVLLPPAFSTRSFPPRRVRWQNCDMRRFALVSTLFTFSLVLAAACGGSSSDETGTTPPGDAGGSGGGSAGKGGAAAGTGGSGGGAAGKGGAGAGGTTAGSGGTPAGSGGTTAGSGGTTAGSGGTTAGSGGTTAGSGGTTAGSGGTTAGSGGTTAGSGGTTAGSGGTTAGAGGSSGTGGGAGGSTTATPQCTSDADCQLENDCCACAGLPASQMLPNCPGQCLIPSCQPFGAKAARCTAGQCTTDVSCDQSKVLCAAPTPQCAKGQVPSVLGACWGPCIDATQCSRVTTCADCASAGLSCVQYDTQLGPQAHCVKVPAPCSDATCACLGPAVCTPPFGLCGDVSKTQVTCGCPTC
jgi:hypothetical protein